jgi:cobalamin-dependent methionine synthase I
MLVVTDNLTLSNPIIFQNIKTKNKSFFYDFFEKCQLFSDYIDINLGQIKKEISEIVKFIFKTMYEVNDFKVVIDTVNRESILECLKYCKTEPILNSFSMDSKKFDKILPIAVENNLDVIALVMDNHIPLTIDDKIILATDIVNIFLENGLSFDKIILDPIVAPLGWENGGKYNQNNLDFLTIVKDAISPEIRTIMGFSNLTTGSTGKNRSIKKLDALYLSMAYSKGIDFSLVNIFDVNIQNCLNFIKTMEDSLIFSPSIFNE